ncbi:HAMP domain-containing histidine kinase [Anoxybacterium hadale]|uniref:HAMP domain-containing histidine kinase n=1 Tax=Anoxybacterium hadale TaxID=3408580 RepID=A0ACD1A751_9FIRM|nr:HAMP domain-containing histidine kinase [Clostridiales bacterium]
MKFSLKAKLSMAIALVALLTVALISLLANYFIQSRFEGYIASQQEKTADQIVESISVQYDSDADQWNTDFVHTIGMYALYDGYIVKVIDQYGKTVWDALTCDMKLCTKVMDDISHRMMMEYPTMNGEFTTRDFPVEQDGKQIGTVAIGYYGPFFFSEDDFQFLKALNQILILIGGLSLIISAGTGVFLARRLSRPILKTAGAAGDIAAGKYNTRIDAETGTKEVDALISSINHLADSLEQQETLRRQLTADVAHELRTPLATVQTHVEAMMEGIWEPTRDRLESCYEEMSRLGNLVSDLERLARIESSNLKLNKTELDLAALTARILVSFEKDLKDKNLNAEIHGSCSLISADSDRMSQVLVNLISNAVKYTLEGGEINITLSDKEASVVFNIRDNGIGIPKEELPFIFERFYRADKSRNRNTGGTGIGLAIVKSIVSAHGGTVEAESRLNEGSDFTMILPKNLEENGRQTKLT